MSGFMSTIFAIAFGVYLTTTSYAQGFPDGAVIPASEDIKKRLGDKVFSVKLADGTSWRLEFKANGYFFVDTSTGFRNSGRWMAEDGKLCTQLSGRDRSCNDVRVHQEMLHLKRDSGEFIQYVPR